MLKDKLWSTMADLKSGGISAADSDAIARLSTEILGVISAQVAIIEAAEEKMPDGLIEFATAK